MELKAVDPNPVFLLCVRVKDKVVPSLLVHHGLCIVCFVYICTYVIIFDMQHEMLVRFKDLFFPNESHIIIIINYYYNNPQATKDF